MNRIEWFGMLLTKNVCFFMDEVRVMSRDGESLSGACNLRVIKGERANGPGGKRGVMFGRRRK